MQSNKPKILVAGATGMVGTSIMRHLVSEHPSVAVSGTWHFSAPFCNGGNLEYVQADLTIREECRKAVRGCSGVIMAAAHSGGAASSMAEPQRQTTDNLVMDANLLEACHAEGVERVVFISSATVYQDLEGVISESGLDWNKDPHPAHFGVGWAKRSAEKLCQFWHLKYGLEVVVARASNVYGPFARFDPGRSNFIPALIRKAADELDPFDVWGSPKVTRDVIFCEDFARAISGLFFAAQIKHDVFNVGSGTSTTVGEVVELALRAAGHRPSRINYTESGPSTTKSRLLDCSKIRQAIDWTPVVSLEQGIRETTLWWTENKYRWKK
jgi:nucleoside-diphosphate-sugar epimerase